MTIRFCRIIFCCDSSAIFFPRDPTELEKQKHKTGAEGIFGQSRWLKILISCAHSELHWLPVLQVEGLSGGGFGGSGRVEMILLFWLADETRGGWKHIVMGQQNSSLTKAIYSLHFFFSFSIPETFASQFFSVVSLVLWTKNHFQPTKNNFQLKWKLFYGR